MYTELKEGQRYKLTSSDEIVTVTKLTVKMATGPECKFQTWVEVELDGDSELTTSSADVQQSLLKGIIELV